MFFRRLEGEGLKVGDAAAALLVSGIKADVEASAGFQSAYVENGISRRDVAHQFSCLRVVHFHNEFLLKTAIKTFRAFYV